MNIKKALSYICWGLLITVLNINLNFSETSSLNILPSFIGWILIYLAQDMLGQYREKIENLKLIPIILAVLTGIQWVLHLMVMGTREFYPLSLAVNLLSAYYEFTLCGMMEDIAFDCDSPRGKTINTLKYVNLYCYLGMAFLGLLALFAPVEPIAMLMFIVGIIALVSIIATIITFFGLRNDYIRWEINREINE